MGREYFDVPKDGRGGGGSVTSIPNDFIVPSMLDAGTIRSAADVPAGNAPVRTRTDYEFLASAVAGHKLVKVLTYKGEMLKIAEATLSITYLASLNINQEAADAHGSNPDIYRTATGWILDVEDNDNQRIMAIYAMR